MKILPSDNSAGLTKAEKLSEYIYKTDLHVHTSPVSPCGQVDAETTVRCYSELGFSSVVITNHFKKDIFDSEENLSPDEWIYRYLNDYEKAMAEGKKRNIQIILGMEIRFPENSNDYLVYGIDKTDVYEAYKYIGGSYEAFYKSFKSDENVIVQAHPFRKGMELQKSELLDGIEVYNMHPGHNSAPAVAAKYASEHPEFIITGGTDFHHHGHQGMCAIRTKEKILNSKHLALVLKSGDYIFDIWGNIII